MAKVRRRIVIRGRVQGVFFRVTTRERAAVWGVAGWVRNTADGSVEAVLEGEEASVEKLVRWCRKGPSGALVTGVDVIPERYTGEFSTFSIEHSYW
jgi:acylphosphatase